MEKIISINNLSIAFSKYAEVVKKVNIDVVKGKTTAIVGESGSGKTLSALSILKLLPIYIVFYIQLYLKLNPPTYYAVATFFNRKSCKNGFYVGICNFFCAL